MKLLFSILLTVAAVLVFVFGTRGVLDAARPLEAERVELEEALGNAKRIRAEREQLQEKYNSFRTEDIDKLHKLLPSHVDSVRLIIEIDGIARSHGMRLDNVRIDSIDKAATPKTIAPLSSKFATLNLSFSVTSNYTNFKSFLADIAESLRVVDVTSLSFSVEGTDAYTYGVTLKTYWLADQPSI